MHVIAIANHKGGVGKSATTHALGTVLAQNGRRVLLVDMDPQASLTASVEVGTVNTALDAVLGGAKPGSHKLAAIIQETGTERLDLAPGSMRLADSEVGMSGRIGRELALRRALATVRDTYNVVLIDTPPVLGLLTVNALVAATGVLVPVIPQAVDLRGLNHFLNTLDDVRAELNPGLRLHGVLPTFFDERLVTHRLGIDAMQQIELPLLPVRIGRSIRVAEAAAARQSICTYEHDNPQSVAYRALGKEAESWLAAPN